MSNKTDRGFNQLIGETIKKIDTTAINIVTVETESGKQFEIDCDEQHFSISILNCTDVSKLRNKS